MVTQTGRMVSAGLLVLRVSAGLMMMFHGIQKIQNFSQLAGGFYDPFGIGPKASLILAIAAEAGCAALFVIGLFTRLACVPLAVTMFVALFLYHAQDLWSARELSALYLGIFVAVFLTGPGALSVDHILNRRTAKAK